MARDWKYGYAKQLCSNALRAEHDRLMSLLPEIGRERMRRVDFQKQDFETQLSLIDLMARSVPEQFKGKEKA